MARKIILLSGVHGVGKGYFLEKNLEKDGRFTVLGASKLISRFKKADDAGYKKVKDVTNNQQVLLKSIEIECDRIKNDIIIDGHIGILDENGEVACIPESFIRDALIDGIILLQDKVENIMKHQVKRDGSNLSCDVIKELQEKELRYCENQFEKYNMPYEVINSGCDYLQFCEIIDRM